MEESKRIFSIQTEGVKNYLTTELAAGEQLIPYCAKLLKNNEIPGLLPMRYQMLDGQVTVKYDISGKIRLGEYMTQRHVPYQAGSMILKNLCDTFRGLPQYFLSVQQCVLDSECVFIGDGLRTFFPCLPVEGEGGESGVSLQSFFAKLLGDYFATEDRTDFDEMFKWVHKSAFFDLEAFEQRFLQAPAQDREGPAETPPKPQPGEAFPVQAAPAGQTAASSNSASETKKKIWEPKSPLPVAGSQKQKEKNAQPAAAPSGAGVLNVPGGGSISIPNAAPQASPKKKKEDPEKEKKGFWIFGNHREKNKDPKEKEQAPASLPAGVPQAVSGAAAPATAPKPAPHTGSGGNPWSEGTIMVKENGGTEIAPEPFDGASPDTAAAWLEHQGNRVAVHTSPFLIGQKNDVFQLHYSIVGNKKVSKNHVSIIRQGQRFMIRDNQSTNGTFLNGQRLPPLQLQELHEGDEIRLYNEALIFHQD